MSTKSLQSVYCLLTFAVMAFAQNSGIRGVVTDSADAVIPGALIKITNIETGVVQTFRTNQVGLYSAPLLNAGRYELTCTASGFADQQRPEIRLDVGQVARIDFKMKLGTVAESIEVSAAAALIQSETTEVGQVIDSKRILEMPLNGRNYLELAQFSVGVLPAGQVGRGNRTAAEGGFLAMGVQTYQNMVTLDGNDNSSVLLGGALSFEAQAVKPAVDAVAEFKVVTSDSSAEYGYRPGAKVLVSTKSGTNGFHGSLYEFLRNDKLDRANFFANRAGSEKPPYRQNQFGGTLGGPVIKNRTFFFASYQGTRIRIGQSNISSVPGPSVLAGDFSNEPVQRRNIFDPLTITGAGANATRLPFPNNRIPASRFDPVAKTVADVYPAPNIAGRDNLPNNFFFAPSDSDDANQYDVRGDHYWSDSQRMFIRYSRRNQNKVEPGPLPLPADGSNWQTIDLKADNVVMNFNSTIGSTKYNEFRIGWTHFPGSFYLPYTENLNKKFGIKNAPGDSFNDGLDQGYAIFSISGFTSLGSRVNWPNIANMDDLAINDGFIWQRGRHALKFGAEFRRMNINRGAQGQRRGQFTLSGVYTSEQPNVASSRANTGNAMADMLLGFASSAVFGNGRGETIIAPYYGFYLQDDFKVTSKLTLNLGLRYELFFTPYFPNPETQSVSRYLTEYNGVSRENEGFVFPKDGRDCGCKEDYNNFAPRLGLAYRLNDKTVVRTGSGLYYGMPSALNEQAPRFFTGPPQYTQISLPQPRETTDIFIQYGFPPFTPGVVLPGVNVDSSPDFEPTLYVGQWFFDVQRTLPGDTLLTLGYAGSKSTHLDVARNINVPKTPNATIRWQDRRIRPEFNTVTYHDNALNANYNALTVKAEKRFSRGYTFLSSFTWSHNIDFFAERQTFTSTAQTDWDLSRERSSSDLDRRLSYNLSVLYELPFGKGKLRLSSGPVARVLGNWQIGGILSWVSGTPVDHTFSVDNQNTGGRVRGDVLRSPDLSGSQRSIDRWFDTGFLTASAPGVIGNAGRNLILGPGKRNLDFVASKNFLMPWEGHQLQFRFEAFNFTNSAHFGVPNTAVGTPAAGQITSADEPRRIQFGLKYVF